MSAVLSNHPLAGAHQFIEYARAIAVGRGASPQAMFFANSRAWHTSALACTKAAVDAGSTDPANWGSALATYAELAAAFATSLRGRSALDTLAPSMRRLPLRTRVAAMTVAIAAGLTAEGAPKPLRRGTIAEATLEPKKATALVVLSDELVRFADSNMLAQELRGAVSDASDEQFFADLLTGAPSSASSGTFNADLATMLAAVNLTGNGALFLVVTPAVVNTLLGTGPDNYPDLTPNGGSVNGITVVVSNQLSEDSSGADIAMIDASQVFFGADPITLDASSEASLIFDDSPAGGASNQVSLYQTNSTALRAERWFAVERMRDSAVHVITGASY